MDRHHNRPHAEGLPANRGMLYEELVHHLPFSVSAVAIGLTIAGIICFLAPALQEAPVPGDAGAPTGESGPAHYSHVEDGAHPAKETEGAHGHEHGHDRPFLELFHLFHPAHMLFSAAATTAMFWRYERRSLKASVVGLIGAVGVCGLSDIVMPQLSLTVLGKPVPWHICIYENPQMVLSFAAVGVILGLAAASSVHRSTFFSHSLHVFFSTMASIFYLIGPFGRLGWIDVVGVVFLFVIVAVMVPCCLSDIVFPMFLAHGAKEEYHRHDHSCCV